MTVMSAAVTWQSLLEPLDDVVALAGEVEWVSIKVGVAVPAVLLTGGCTAGYESVDGSGVTLHEALLAEPCGSQLVVAVEELLAIDAAVVEQHLEHPVVRLLEVVVSGDGRAPFAWRP